MYIQFVFSLCPPTNLNTVTGEIQPDPVFCPCRWGGRLEEQLHTRTKQRDGRDLQGQAGGNSAGRHAQVRAALPVGSQEAGVLQQQQNLEGQETKKVS